MVTGYEFGPMTGFADTRRVDKLKWPDIGYLEGKLMERGILTLDKTDYYV